MCLLDDADFTDHDKAAWREINALQRRGGDERGGPQLGASEAVISVGGAVGKRTKNEGSWQALGLS